MNYNLFVKISLVIILCIICYYYGLFACTREYIRELDKLETEKSRIEKELIYTKGIIRGELLEEN